MQPPGTDPRAQRWASVFTLANGYFGVRGSLEECAVGPDTILPHVFVRRSISYHEAFPGYARATDTRILCPSPTLVRLTIDGLPVDFGAATITHFGRCLNLATGQLDRTTHWRLADGREIAVHAERVVAPDRPVVGQRLRLTALNFAASIALVPRFGTAATGAAHDPDDPRISARLAPPWTASPEVEGATTFACGDLRVTYRSAIAAPPGALRDDGAGGAVVAYLANGESLGFDRVVDVGGGAEPLPTFAAVAGAQARAGTDFIAAADCSVDDDPGLTQALRFGLFQLYQSASRSAASGTAAKGLTSDGYEGHVFWDAEAFMLPVLAFTAPAIARHVIEFRMGTLDAARANARLLGHARGALYPWRTISGGECSSHYPTGAAQVHVNGDIAYAVELYVQASGDDGLRRAAAEMLFETARVWSSLGHFDPRRANAFGLHGVTGPDEYTVLADNDFYTNAVAARHLRYAAATAAWLQATNPADYRALAARLALTGVEIAGWTAAADAMWLPVDPQQQVNPQDDTFLGKPPLSGDLLRAPRRPLLLDHDPMTLFRHRVAKQGNVVQALAMGLVEQPVSLTARNYAFYEPLTSHDSTLSAPAFGIVAARIGAFADARRFLEAAASVDLDDRHHNTGDGLHLAALAGGWLVLAQGWAGLAVRNGEIHFAPRAAPELPGYQLTVTWRGSRLRLHVDGDGATYTLLSGPPVAITDHARPVTIAAEPVRLCRPRAQAVIFDLDGVLTDTAEHHYHAWAALAQRHGLPFDRAFNRQLKGIDRSGSLRLILDRAGVRVDADVFAAMLADKNSLYQRSIADYSSADLFDGVRDLLAGCRMAGILTAVASASRNAAAVLDRLGIAAEFDFVADAGAVARPKPAPDIFLACARALGIAPNRCIGVEDAQAGIEAIRAAGMIAVGIDPDSALTGAALTVPAIGRLDMSAIGSLV